MTCILEARVLVQLGWRGGGLSRSSEVGRGATVNKPHFGRYLGEWISALGSRVLAPDIKKKAWALLIMDGWRAFRVTVEYHGSMICVGS